MGNKIEFKGKKFGCWLIKEQLESKLANCGTMRAFWKIECLNCGNIFEETTRNIRRKLNFPEGCKVCEKKKVASRNGLKQYWGNNADKFLIKE